MQIQSGHNYFLISLLTGLLNCLQLFSYDIDQAPLTLRQPTVAPQMVVDPIFLPVVFTGKILPEGYLENTAYELPKLSNIEKIVPNHMLLDMPSSFFEKRRRMQELTRKAYLYSIMTDPSVVEFTRNDFLKKTDTIEQIEANPFKNLFKLDTNMELSRSGDLTKFSFRKRYWFINGNHLLQFSQNYISDNWSSGGVGNLNFLSNQNVKVHYEKSKIQFNSFLEWNMSFFTNPNDTLRATRIGTDLIRSFSDFGFKAFDRWYYSTNLELKTQFFNNHKENTRTKLSTFMSPFYLNMGILGMRYELDKKFKSDKYKTLNISADFSPLSVKYVSVTNPDVDPTRYGIPEGETSLLDLGSTINTTMVYNISRFTRFKSRFKYFTNFEQVEVESENEVNFSINRYFSTRILLYLRYNDRENIPKDPTLGYFQINELISFGFNYRW